MLKLSRSDSYSYPVKGSAIDDDGERCNFSFTAKFKRVDSDMYEAIIRATNRYKKHIESGLAITSLEEEHAATEARPAVPFTMYDVARFVWVGWVDDGQVLDDDGSAVQFTEELRDQYLKRQGVPQAVLDAWFESVGPKGDLSGARAKNSKASRGIG